MINSPITKTSSDPEDILRPVDISRWLKVSRSWPYAMVKRGLLPHFKMEKVLRFKRGDIEQFLKNSWRG